MTDYEILGHIMTYYQRTTSRDQWYTPQPCCRQRIWVVLSGAEAELVASELMAESFDAF